jgi:predicted RNase H-like nuclease (RuvC/YqgF family)
MLRRQRNSAAARKYRQKRLDRIEELEQALQKTQTERDELKMQVARWKGKAEALQSLMARSGVGGMQSRG